MSYKKSNIQLGKGIRVSIPIPYLLTKYYSTNKKVNKLRLFIKNKGWIRKYNVEAINWTLFAAWFFTAFFPMQLMAHYYITGDQYLILLSSSAIVYFAIGSLFHHWDYIWLKAWWKSDDYKNKKWL